MFPQQFLGNGPVPGQFYNFLGGISYSNATLQETIAPGTNGTQHKFSLYSGQQMFPQQFLGNGPVPGQFYNFLGGISYSNATRQETIAPGTNGTQRKFYPETTGGPVVGIKFDNGVMIGADNLVSSGSFAEYQNIQRVCTVNKKIVLGTGGDFADFQSLKRSIDAKVHDDSIYDYEMKPKSLYTWITRTMYSRRSSLKPMFLDMVVGGMENTVPFLGHVDWRGCAYESEAVATSWSDQLALPLVRAQLAKGKILTQAEASELMGKCMEVLYYRHCRSISEYSVAVCTKDGSVVQGPRSVSQNWQLATLV